MLTKVKVVEIRPGASPVFKSDSTWDRYNPWKCPVVMVLEDGREVTPFQSFRLKREAVEYRNSLPKFPHNISALFEGDRMVGTEYLIGA